MKNNNILFLIDNLVVEIFVIGYPDKGESQIIFLTDRTNNSIIFSCVIDCYRHQNINKTIEVLKERNISILDMFIWTHTDIDHSLGIVDLVTSYCNKKTNFILPELVYGNLNDFIEYNNEIKESFDVINSFNTGTNYNVNSATVVPNGHASIWRNKFIDKDNGAELIFEILAIAPCSALLRRRYGIGEINKKNDLSIATIFKIGQLNLLFSGDIENQTINQIADYHFENLAYLKTPHHTSTTSTNLIEKIKNNFNFKIPTAVTTVYKSNNLPHNDVVNEYKKITDNFYSTGIGNDYFGITYTKYHILSNSITEEILTGNAILL